MIFDVCEVSVTLEGILRVNMAIKANATTKSAYGYPILSLARTEMDVLT
jgi:hypothetical protein